jgi:N-acetylglucosaminyldiphosphoundecaprenol N-acetyl-beta-D-mannosaminyltransferase
MKKTSVQILGIRINIVNYDLVLSLIKKCIQAHSSGNYICVCPVHSIMVSQRDCDLKRALDKSLLAVPDGRPVVWAARLLGASIDNAVRGTNLTLLSSEMAEKEGYPIFLYGANEETLGRMKENLLKRFPQLRIVGMFSPPFRNLTPNEKAEIIDRINLANPQILFVGLGAPKQEKWMASFCPSLKVPVTLGVGAAFDFLSGEKKEAPLWMQARGLEWLFRLLKEPGRLWFRYVVYNPLYIFSILKQLLRERLRCPVQTDSIR